MVTVPVREGLALGFTFSDTGPAPVPLGVATVIQSTPALALHGHPGPVVIDAFTLPPSPATSCDEGAIAYVQPLACAIATVRPATVMAPLRPGPSFVAAANWTCPLPLPLAPPVIVIHGAPLAAVQAHPAPAFTCTLPLLACAATLTLPGATV